MADTAGNTMKIRAPVMQAFEAAQGAAWDDHILCKGAPAQGWFHLRFQQQPLGAVLMAQVLTPGPRSQQLIQ